MNKNKQLDTIYQLIINTLNKYNFLTDYLILVRCAPLSKTTASTKLVWDTTENQIAEFKNKIHAVSTIITANQAF